MRRTGAHHFPAIDRVIYGKPASEAVSEEAERLKAKHAGGTFDVPHYYCTPVIMPSLLRYNKPFTEDAQKRLSTSLGAPGEEAADAFAKCTRKVGLPGRLADVGIGEDQFERISKIAIHHRFVQATSGMSTPVSSFDIGSDWTCPGAASKRPPTDLRLG